MHLRRALLLFAIVIGLAALAASMTPPPQERRTAPRETQQTPTVQPGPGPAAEPTPVVTLPPAGERTATRRVDAGEPVTVEVMVEEPGSVEIPSLGLSAPATPLAPARFELLPAEPGRHELVFTPADGDETEPAGTLVVR